MVVVYQFYKSSAEDFILVYNGLFLFYLHKTVPDFLRCLMSNINFFFFFFFMSAITINIAFILRVSVSDVFLYCPVRSRPISLSKKEL